MVRKIGQGPVIQMDETRVQVMKEPGRSNTKNSYMRPARGGPPDTPLVYYHYDYLTWIFKTAPRLSKAQYENLLPWKMDRGAAKRAAGRGWRN